MHHHRGDNIGTLSWCDTCFESGSEVGFANRFRFSVWVRHFPLVFVYVGKSTILWLYGVDAAFQIKQA
jgi:hypothetical protein